MIKTIVFDLGGVILNFSHKIIIDKLSNISGRKDSEIFDFIISSGLEKLYDTGKISSHEFYNTIKNFLNIDISFKFFSKIWEEIFSDKPEMSRFIDYLNQKKIPIVLLSNTNELHFNYCLRTFPVFKKIPKYFLSYELGIRKPSKEIFQKLIAALDLKPEELLFVDDIEENIIAAEGMGINTIHYVSHDNFLQKIREFNIM